MMTPRARKIFLTALRQALEAVRDPRFFESERGYQGELLAELRDRVGGAFPGDPIVEQEYQKSIPAHRIRIRPDLIVHIPFERGTTEGRDNGNFVAIEIKREKRGVSGAFENLRVMKEELGYPLTILIMVDSDKTFACLCPRCIARQTVCFAVRLEPRGVRVRSQSCGKPAGVEPSG